MRLTKAHCQLSADIARTSRTGQKLLALNRQERAARSALIQEAQDAREECSKLVNALAKEERLRTHTLEQLSRVSSAATEQSRVASLKEKHLVALLSRAELIRQPDKMAK